MNDLWLERQPIVALSRDEVEQARRLAAQVHRNLPPTPNYTGLAVADRFRFGYLGELGMVAYLRMLGVWHFHHIKTDGTSQPTELTVRLASGATLRVEVKAASKPSYRELMFPAAQKIDFGVVVGARLESPHLVSLQGWLVAVEAAAMPVKIVPPHETPTRCRLFTTLHPMCELACQLERDG